MITPQLREAAKLIAIATARANPPPYFAEPFEPHAWVVEAIAIGMCAGVESGVERATLAATTKSLIKHVELGQKIVKLEEERDAARAEIERLARVHAGQVEYASAEHQEMYTPLAKRLVSERDAAVVEVERLRVDASRYARLRLLGCAPSTSEHLNQGLVICFTNLDKFVDDDIAIYPSRGEARP